MRWNGTTLGTRVNGGAWQSTARGNATTSGAVQFGRNSITSAGYFDGLMREIMCAAAHWTDEEADNIYAYLKATYPAASLP
jgi:hypothetical protein